MSDVRKLVLKRASSTENVLGNTHVHLWICMSIIWHKVSDQCPMYIAVDCAVPYIVVCNITVGDVVVKKSSARPLVVVGRNGEPYK